MSPPLLLSPTEHDLHQVLGGQAPKDVGEAGPWVIVLWALHRFCIPECRYPITRFWVREYSVLGLNPNPKP